MSGSAAHRAHASRAHARPWIREWWFESTGANFANSLNRSRLPLPARISRATARR